MKTNTFLFTLVGAFGLAATSFAGVEAPSETSVASVEGRPVVGALFFREDCIVSNFENPVLPGEQVLQVFLTDADNNVLTDGIAVNPDGTFTIPDVAPGGYYLRIQAENLNSFWDGAAFKSLPVWVSEEATAVNVGNLCVDNAKPEVGGIEVVSDATATLPHAQLGFHASVLDADQHPLQLAWTVNTGELVYKNATEVAWINTEGASQVLLELTVRDDHGAEQQVSRIVEVPVKKIEVVATR